MSSNLFFKKVLTYLAELNKDKHLELIESGWLSEDEAYRIELILKRTGCIEEFNGLHITSKGLNILLNFKMGKIHDEYDHNVLEILMKTD